jgi:hypothetical protein
MLSSTDVDPGVLNKTIVGEVVQPAFSQSLTAANPFGITLRWCNAVVAQCTAGRYQTNRLEQVLAGGMAR